MVDYIKYRNTSPLSRKSKKFDGARYKQYLYGSVEALDDEWADKIVDYNPDLKLNINGFTKYVDRNVSMSTECGFDLKSSLNSNADMYISDDLSNSVSEYTQAEGQYQQYVKGGFQSAVLSNVDSSNIHGAGKTKVPVIEYPKYEELQKKYDELSSEFSKYKEDQQSNVSDAELYRSCKQRMGTSKPELDSENDPKESLELLLDHIYSVLADTFGSDNTVVAYLEKFANIYVDHQNKVEVELATLRGKAEVVDSLDKLVADKANYDKLVDQKDKTINSLVEELKASKLNHTDEMNSLKDKLDCVIEEFKSKLDLSQAELDKYRSENESLVASVTHWKSEYTKLLSDQYQILSQLPLATLKTTTGVDSSSVVHKFDSNNNEGLNHEFGKQVPGPVTLANVNKSWNNLNDKSFHDFNKDPFDKYTSSIPGFDTKFLQSLVETLYRKNEEAVELIRRKDDVIKKQNAAISRLQESVKEWESDAVLWLDYVDQSSSVLKGVN